MFERFVTYSDQSNHPTAGSVFFKRSLLQVLADILCGKLPSDLDVYFESKGFLLEVKLLKVSFFDFHIKSSENLL